jgi:nitrogen PTS system EIIA component
MAKVWHLKDISDLLQLSEKVLVQWIEQNKIPAYRVDGEYVFNPMEIQEWILENQVTVSHAILDLAQSKGDLSLHVLLQKGGICTGLQADSVPGLIQKIVYTVPTPIEINKDKIVFHLQQREDMMPTAIGRGIAVLHPRTPVVSDVRDECLSLCLLAKPLDFNALDRVPVSTCFLLLASTVRRHLEAMARIAFLCQDERFHALLLPEQPGRDILDFIAKKEYFWNSLREGK